MVSKGKILKKFLENPASLKINDIEKIFIDVWCKVLQGKWSHKKVIHNNLLILTFPVHNWDCLKYYKNEARKIYINNFVVWTKQYT